MKNRIGIVGGGQLGRMLAFEAKKMGFTVKVLDPTPKSPAGQVVDEQIVADFKDEPAIRKLAAVSDFLTFEIELANSQILDELAADGVEVNPSAKTLTIVKDKFKQKKFLAEAHIPLAKFKKVQTKEDIVKSAAVFGYPLLLKARFDSYDGRGNALIKSEKDIDKACEKLGFSHSGKLPKGAHPESDSGVVTSAPPQNDGQFYIEQFVPFTKELAVMVARSTKGEIITYPVVETIHKNNICHTVFAPARVNNAIQSKAQNLARKVMRHLKGAGVFGIEMFLAKDGKVLVNEIAPRVHNSGHYTIEACTTSQFEQHIRAITGMPLGKTDMIVPAAVMVNILGDRKSPAEVSGLDKALEIPNTFVHIYGKAETKVERKMGHITAIDKTLDKAYKKAVSARKYIKI